MRSELIVAGVITAGAVACILYATRASKSRDADATFSEKTDRAVNSETPSEGIPSERLLMAQDAVARADMKLRGYRFLGGLGAKYNDAAELLEAAGNDFELANSCEWPFCFYMQGFQVRYRRRGRWNQS